MRAAVVTVALVALIAAVGCSPARSPVIDTWPIGRALDCEHLPSCDELVQVGLAGLADREPDLGPIVATQLHAEGTFFDASTGHQILMNRSGGCCSVLVVELADGTRHAIGVGFPGISDRAMAIPWESVPG